MSPFKNRVACPEDIDLHLIREPGSWNRTSFHLFSRLLTPAAFPKQEADSRWWWGSTSIRLCVMHCRPDNTPGYSNLQTKHQRCPKAVNLFQAPELLISAQSSWFLSPWGGDLAAAWQAEPRGTRTWGPWGLLCCRIFSWFMWRSWR